MTDYEFKKTFLSSLKSSREASKQLAEFLFQHQVLVSDVQHLELCVVEVMNNAFIHSYDEQEGEPIELECAILSDSKSTHIEMRISDYGRPIKKSVFQEHTNKEIKAPSLFDEDSWMSSGRGLMLISNLVDSFQVLRSGRKNTFVLIKRERRLTTKQSSVTLPSS
ncbi:ATP-binding protein [Vibrio parahaemolyticus]|uniref:ATP-binding protein n=1 Tax=Vibrio parahaemolyticus TaxID=670 RepID=UPI0003FA87C2|nr:ATP-binding protein [Vibrio parahaemolyticus]EGR0767510.1 ATP-binding protein [Vibrio parahaemolyticus]EGR0837045.1 ATP-binding protein [Vibrio parahaemolyticus]EGR1751801.1 ATP-binding protein [Vibrio parahaemolyticus]EHH1241698.1 ATP-binding protein [Vibrio parahaemolyticus]EHK0749198.1 ATP-binding protein [Vibrio parahaemolyticus]